MAGEQLPTWGDVWARSHEATAPRYEWPVLFIEIWRACGMTEEEIAAFPPPTEEWTLAKLLAGVAEKEREGQRRALTEWFGWNPGDGPPSAEIREAFNLRALQERSRYLEERDAQFRRGIAEGLDARATSRRTTVPLPPAPLGTFATC